MSTQLFCQHKLTPGFKPDSRVAIIIDLLGREAGMQGERERESARARAREREKEKEREIGRGRAREIDCVCL